MKKLVLFCLMALLAAMGPARGVTINITYDASVTNSGYATSIQSALGVVTNNFHVLFTNATTVNVVCYWGSAGPFLDYDVGVSASVFPEIGPFTYPNLTNALRGARASANDSNSVASLPPADPIATNKWWVPRAEVKVLPVLAGIAGYSPTDKINDGSITFGPAVLMAFSPTNRAVPGKYDFIAAAEHEISEVMGRTYELNEYQDGRYVPYDLFRFTNVNTRCFDPNADNAYFSVNKGTNNLRMFYEEWAIDPGNDACDWEPASQPDTFDAYYSMGQIYPFSPLDVTVMDILGYHSPAFTPPRLSGRELTNTTFQISFTNVANAPFSVFATTNVAWNLTNWTYLGPPFESPTGHYQFIDGPVATNQARFYRVRLP